MKRNEKQGVLFEIEPRQEDKQKKEKDKKEIFSVPDIPHSNQV